jgi:choline-sulfatase
MTILKNASAILLAALVLGPAVSCSKNSAPSSPPAEAPQAGAPAAASAPLPTGPPPPGSVQTPLNVDAGTPGPAVHAVPAVSTKGKPNLLLITMASTRADHLGCYDNPEVKTPTLDTLAHEGLLFTQAVAVAPLTLPSTASILTGLYPPRLGVRSDSGARLAAAETTLAEHLKAQGYATAAAVGSRILGGDAGFKQGFDGFAGPPRTSRSAAFVIDDAMQAVNRLKGGPFFLWVQLDDPNAPYTPPPGFFKMFENRPYDGEIAWMDSQLTRLIAHMKSWGLLDTTLIVATADHGESLGDHGEETHGVFVYDSTLKVPLIVRYPPLVIAGSKFPSVVSGVDIVPTVLELMGLPPLPGVQGESCVARLSGKDVPEREVVYAESLYGQLEYGWAPLHALRSAKEKFIDAPEPELYDLKRDPTESINVAKDQKETVEGSWHTSMAQALHDIGGGSAPAPAARSDHAPVRDPKSVIAASNFFIKAQLAIALGQADQARTLLNQALAKDPGNPAVSSLLAALHADVPKTGAEENTFAGQWNRGNAFYVHGQYDEAARAFRAALALNPKSAETHYALGIVLAAKDDTKGAETELRAAVAADPKMADGWNKLGLLMQQSNRRSDAMDAYARSLEAVPDNPDALFNRARLELLDKNVKDARSDLDKLVAAHKDYPAAGFLEAHVCVAEGNAAGAKEALTKFLALTNTDPRMKSAATDMLQKLGG